MDARKLLVVDDDTSICELLQNIGESCGYETKTSTNAEEFKQFFTKFKPEVLIMDLNLGKTDGIELLRYLSYLNASCKIILISGHEERILSIAHQLGVSHGLDMHTFLQKPISVNTMKKALAEITSSNESIRIEDVVFAVENQELILHFQPKISMDNSKIIGVESLVRWHRNNAKLVMPNDFIPFVESNNLTKIVTMAIIKIALHTFPEIQRDHATLEIAINLSGKDLDDLEFPDKIQDVAKNYNINPEQICFEVTETSIMAQAKIVMEILTRLRLKGFLLSVDDFGTGYSSLIELRKMPINELKIDRSFVKDLLTNKDDQVITKSLIDLGHNLGLKVTAEGVESKEILERLSDYKCDIAQGYYYSKPLALSEIKKWITAFPNESFDKLS